MMIAETLLPTVLTEWLRKYIPKRPAKNNLPEIREMKRRSTITVASVGELRDVLDNFADDVPLEGGFGWPTIHLREVDGVGKISIGSANYQSPYRRVSK